MGLCGRACEGPACQASGAGEMAFERCDGRGEEAGYNGASPRLSGSAGVDVLGRVEVVAKRDDLAAIVERPNQGP